MKTLTAILTLANLALIFAGPINTENDLVVTTTEIVDTTLFDEKALQDEPDATIKDKETKDDGPPTITRMDVTSDVADRFAKTVVKSKVKNPSSKAQETTFFVVIPDQAFISGFIMEIGGKNYTAYVQEKEKAKQTYDQAVASGIGAAHVAVSARDSNKFTVSTNIEPEGKAVFYLTYEELLDRKDGFYELVINIHPKQLVKDLNVEVRINETDPLSFVKTPAIRSGNEISKEDNTKLNPAATITKDKNTATVKFNPDYEKQKQLAKELGSKENEGLSGQFVVQYDIERDPSGGRVLLKDGYFVHFFAPSDLAPLNKHIVFVLDTSGSMWGERIKQLKEAMTNILGELNPNDFFNLVEFNTIVKVWNLDAPEESTQFPENENSWYVSDEVKDLNGISFAPAYPVNNNTIKKTNTAVGGMVATGGTNIFDALRVGIHLIKLREKRVKDKNIQPLILFLTDGEPTVGRTLPEKIISGVSEENIAKIPIISLSFGDGADKAFLKKLSLNNFGFARHIYEHSDASLQLEKFYKQISSPLLSNVKFDYVDDKESLSQTSFPLYYRGREIIVCGRYTGDFKPPTVSGLGITGPINLQPSIKTPVGQLERLWAYKTVKKFLAEKDLGRNETENEKKALDLALKYSFVTPVTSLVVVKPNETKSVEAEEASASNAMEGSGGAYPISGYPMAASGQQLAFGGGFAPIYSSAPQFQAGYPALGIAGVPGVPGPPTTTFKRPMLGVDYDLDSIKVEDLILNTTPATTSTTIPPINLPTEYKQKLPWLQDQLRPDGSLAFFKGNYKLGFNETSPEDLECTNPNSGNGQCKLVKDCEVLYPSLVGPKEFKDYFCVIDDKFAGVCCPKKDVKKN